MPGCYPFVTPTNGVVQCKEKEFAHDFYWFGKGI